jgi:radical SAM superfamily enzyme YgiQ (UPF0313 family)
VRNSGRFRLDHDLKTLPWIDRDLTQWRLYAEKNGNYRRTPGTYIMSGRDCWHGKCTFCSWTTLYPSFRARDPKEVVDEIGDLIERYGVREIMDDTGCLPAGAWLKTFCEEMIARGYHKRVKIDCNMRFGLSEAEYRADEEGRFTAGALRPGVRQSEHAGPAGQRLEGRADPGGGESGFAGRLKCM